MYVTAVVSFWLHFMTVYDDDIHTKCTGCIVSPLLGPGLLILCTTGGTLSGEGFGDKGLTTSTRSTAWIMNS